MANRGRHRRRRIEWGGIIAWLIIAVLAHVGVLVALYVSSLSIGPPDRPVVAVTLRQEANPFREPAPTPAIKPQPEVVPDDRPVSAAETVPPPTPAPIPPDPVTTEESPDQAAPGPPADSSSPDRPSGRFGNRSGKGRAGALHHYGGGAETEEAVLAGLRWLATHQRRDGAWDRKHFDERCPELDRCRETAAKLLEHNADPATTGLALMAFLGAGHTHEQGDFQNEVTLALTFLLEHQLPNGSFAEVNTLEMYNHTIATIAIAEAFTMTGDLSLKMPMLGAVRHLLSAQQARGGWGYTSERSIGRNDTSVTGWAMLALSSAHSAGVAIPDRTIVALIDFVSETTAPDAHVYYARLEDGRIIEKPIDTALRRYSPSTTAIGMLVRQLLGWRTDASVLLRQERILLGEPPDLGKFRGGDASELHSEYYWYYGTLAMFNQGGVGWQEWNDHLRAALLPAQDLSLDARDRQRHSYGSFPAFGRGWGRWGRVGGRVYSTAMGVLMLESYYRYVPAYLARGGLIRSKVLRSGLSSAEGVRRLRLVLAAADMHADVGEAVLVDVLRDPDGSLRLRAAIGLSRFGSPMGRQVLEAGRAGATGGERQAVDDALVRIDALLFPEQYGLIVQIEDARKVILFETRGSAVYVGQLLVIQRGPSPVATARVTHEFTREGIAAALIVDELADLDPPRLGDVVAQFAD